MKRICDLYDIDDETIVNDIKINSKEVVKGDVFVCTMGVTADRHDFVEEAVKNGASLIVASRKIDVDTVVKYVEDTNQELIYLARKLYDFNDSKLDLIGVTGTNGKTTVALMIKNLLGEDTGYIGTNGIISKSFNQAIRNTTPDADRLYKYFKKFTDDGCNKLVMETSSEAFYRNRLETLNFNISILTNITEDHLNIHKTIENYVDCKMDLFRKTKNSGFCILNKDDKYYDLAFENSNGKVVTYGKNDCDLQIIDYKLFVDKTEISVKYDNIIHNFTSPYLGEVNVYNLAASILACICLGKDINEVINKVMSLPKIAGRLDFISSNKDYEIVLDYAHTLDAFKKIIPFLKEVCKNKLVVVTGAAGGRQQDKRAGIGKYLLENSNLVIFTTDDPRNENVDDIIKDLISDSKLTNYKIIKDREEAITNSFEDAKEGDIILIAGKGNDNYMAIGNEYIPYSDLEVINRYLQK